LRHEVLLGWQELKGQGILLVDAVLDGGVAQPFASAPTGRKPGFGAGLLRLPDCI
jgi:hypothetical protein